MQTLAEFANNWTDTPEFHQQVIHSFSKATCDDPLLFKHRWHIMQNSLGFGDTAFHWLWKLIVEQMPKSSRFLEVGVYKGQVLSLIPYLAMHLKHGYCASVGVSLFDGRGLYQPGGWTGPDGHDYRVDVLNLFKHFDLPDPILIVGDSTHAATAYDVSKHGPYDLIYIDGSHEAEDVESDLYHYTDMLKTGGILACDDCGNYLNLPKDVFGGFIGCSARIDTLLPPNGPTVFNEATWQHLGNVAHLRIWRKLS